jgi:hypothetical protein
MNVLPVYLCGLSCEVALPSMCEPAPVELDIGRPMDTALLADSCTSTTQSTQECDADLSPATENTDSYDGIVMSLCQLLIPANKEFEQELVHILL